MTDPRDLNNYRLKGKTITDSGKTNNDRLKGDKGDKQ